MKRFRKKRLFVIALLIIFLFPLSLAQTIRYFYDPAGRLVRADYGQGKAIFYAYDPAGNILSRNVFVPCFDWNTFTSVLPDWHDGNTTVLTLLPYVECPPKNN